MKFAVVNNAWPFLSGGAEHVADSLVQRLRASGHETVLLKPLFCQTPVEAIPRSILAARLTRIPDCDRIICLKFPAFYIPHDYKILWILHQYRSAYELAHTPFGALPANDLGERIRNVIQSADNEYLREARKIYASHETTAKRLLAWNGITAEPLLCPHGGPGRFYSDGCNDTVVAFGRISRMKRQHLAVKAMAYTRTAVKLHLAGLPEDDDLEEQIRSLIRENRLEEKVVFEPRFISEEEKADTLARSLAAVYVPFEEDSHGYVTIEAFYSSKACVTCSDSGGILSAVKDGETGFVTAPDPRAIAEAFDRLFADRDAARRMGESGRQYALELPDKWDSVLTRFTS